MVIVNGHITYYNLCKLCDDYLRDKTLHFYINCLSCKRLYLHLRRYYWWLVRVTLVVDWLFLPQNFGPVVGTYEGLLRLCEWTLGGDCTSRWWGHISNYMSSSKFFPPLVVGALKPSITLVSLPSLPLAPLPLPLLTSLPSLPLTPSCPLPPQRWWGPKNIV